MLTSHVNARSICLVVAAALVASLACFVQPARADSSLVAVQEEAAGTAANSGTGSTTDTATEPTTPATPETATVYVLTKIGSTKLTYNSKGQLKTEKTAESNITFKYKKNLIVSFKAKPATKRTNRSSSGTVTYDKKNRVKRIKSSGSSSLNTYNLKYSYDKKNRVTKESGKFSGSKHSQEYTYNKKGRVTKISGSTPTDVTYDKKGNVTRLARTFSSGFTFYTNYKYTYNKAGRATKRGLAYMNGSTYYTSKLKYKAITVPYKYVQQIQEQQYALLNPDVSFALPRYF